MKLTVKIMAAMLALLILLTLLMTPALAAGSVQYVGGSRKFVFKPGSDQSPTDLFGNFKDVMPGDKLTDTIEVRNDLKTSTKIRLYLRSLGAQENTQDFLSQLKLSVQVQGGSEVFASNADQSTQLKDWTYLGTVKPGEKIQLNLTLQVPIEMGNEFQNQTGYIDWEFKIEEVPYSDGSGSSGSVPETGDRNDLIFYGGLILLSLIVLFLLIFGRRKKREE